jgi:hypothetical protein
MSIAGAKNAFFDKKAVTNKLAPAVRAALSRLGGYARKVARNSLKYSKRRGQHAAPGQPPLVHKYSRFSREKTNKKTGVTTRQIVSPLRELLFYKYDDRTKSVVIGPELWPGSKGGGAKALKTIEANHPLMKPALKKTVTQVPPNFKNLIR